MSRSEQLHDASMEEILASIRKIITDDEPDAPSGDTFSATAIDDFREASATLARGLPAGGYMHDLTRALAGEQPAPAADDDIFDDDAPETARPSVRAERSEALRHETFTASAADDDADLFETEPEAAIEQAPEPAVVAIEADEEIIEDLGEPIALGPEIELVEEAAEAPLAVAPDIVEVVAVPEAETREATASDAVEATEAAAEPVPETPVAVALPPPPPPVVSAMPEEVAAPVAEALPEVVANVTEAVVETATAAAASDVSDVAAFAPAPVLDAMAEAVATPIAEAIDKSDPPQVEAIAESVAEAPAEAIPETIAPSLEVSAAALVEELSASISEASPAATPVADMADAVAEPAPVESAPPEAAPSPSAAPLVPDDMMAAMLKPMLKEWLDANMPRIVAKAMGEKDSAGS